jgi:Ni/Fe-hydrogenase subunit HybB-like protein
MAVGFGTASVLFLVAWHVATYLTVQLLEFSPAILEWLKARRVRKWATMITIGMTIAGIILSTLHQSALGAMFLLAPGKMHPLWYSQYLPVFFLSSSIYAALAMVIVVSTLGATFLRNKTDHNFLSNLDPLTIGLGKGAAVGIYVYFFEVMAWPMTSWSLRARPTALFSLKCSVSCCRRGSFRWA